MATVKITENRNLERDLDTSAVINTNITAFQARLNRINNRKEK